MRKILIILVLAALGLSAGIFAYTALTGTATTPITGGGTEFATVTEVGYSWGTKPTGGRIGSVDTGDLYTVARDSDYPGDLVFTLALVNVDELVGKFVYLDLEIKVTDATTAVVATEWLTMEEAVVELIVPAVNASPFTVRISDGAYRVEKSKDPTVTPTFKLRVRQR